MWRITVDDVVKELERKTGFDTRDKDGLDTNTYAFDWTWCVLSKDTVTVHRAHGYSSEEDFSDVWLNDEWTGHASRQEINDCLARLIGRAYAHIDELEASKRHVEGQLLAQGIDASVVPTTSPLAVSDELCGVDVSESVAGRRAYDVPKQHIYRYKVNLWLTLSIERGTPTVRVLNPIETISAGTS